MSPRPILLALVLVLATACEHAEPPTRPDTQPSTSVAREPARRRIRPRPEAVPSASAPAPAPELGDAAAPSSADAAAADAATSAEPSLAELAPKLVADDGKPLEQTEAEPSLDSKWFKAGLATLFRAIQEDDPRLAEPFFFPIEGYRKVKDVADPDRDYRHRLLANFRRDVHDYHAKLGPHAKDAKFQSIDVPMARKRWMKPHTEGNKLGYFRVTHSRLHYVAADGKPMSFEVTSFISWRGEWYLVHLNGFK